MRALRGLCRDRYVVAHTEELFPIWFGLVTGWHDYGAMLAPGPPYGSRDTTGMTKSVKTANINITKTIAQAKQRTTGT